MSICAIIDKTNTGKLDVHLAEQLIEPAIFDGIGNAKTLTEGNVGLAVYDQFSSDASRFLYSDPEVMVVCDAEIYNYKSLLNGRLDGAVLSEARIIAGLYKQFGRLWSAHLQGVYGVFIWDKKKDSGYASTDRVGVKPIVYYENSDLIVIASRIGSIAALPGFGKRLNRQAIYSYFFMEMIPTPFTIFEGVHKLESGHSLEINGQGVTINQDWDMAYPEEKVTSEKEIEEKIYSLTRQAVEMQLNYRSGIDNVGCFLSGGTDSSTVAGLINELYPGQAKTFSIGFDESGFDEMYYARIAAKAFSTRHIEYYVSPKDIFEQLPRIVANYDEPFANSSVIPTYYCSKVAKENGIDVLLGGDGGDEVFGGNKRYHDNFADFQKYPQWLVNSLWPVLHTIPGFMRVSVVKKAYNHVRRARAPLHERIHSYSLLQYFAQDDVFDADFLAAEDYIQPAEISQKYIDRVDTDNPLDRYLYNDLKLTLMDNDLRKVTQMTSLANVNVRYPFLDFRIIEFSGLIPPELKVNNGQLRYVFKKAFGKLLPAEIIGKSKHGFGLPVVPWMLRPGQLNDMLRDIVFSQSTYNRGIFKRSFVEKLYKESLSDKTTFYGTYLYFILFLEMWLREHVDRKNG